MSDLIPELMSTGEAAEHLGVDPGSVRSTLRRYGITQQRGWSRTDVENLSRHGRGRRTDLLAGSDRPEQQDPADDQRDDEQEDRGLP